MADRKTHPVEIAYQAFDANVKRTLDALQAQFSNIEKLPSVEGEKKLPRQQPQAMPAQPFNPLGGM